MAEIGIIIPVYNVEDYLEKCLQSILAQTFEAFEILLIDDGSTDRSGGICDEYAQMDERIRVVHKENGGPSEARNWGLEANESDYIIFIDADDYVEIHYLEILYRCVKERDADIAICCSTAFVEEENPEKVHFDHQAIISRSEIISKAEAYKRMMQPGDRSPSVCAWGKIYHRNLFSLVRYPAGEIYEDCKVIDQIIEASNRIVYIPYAGYFYLVRQGSITHGEVTQGHLASVYNAKHLLDLMEDKYPEVRKMARGYYAGDCMHLFKIMAEKTEYRETCLWLRQEIRQNCKELIWYSCENWNVKCSVICICIGISCYKVIRKIHFGIGYLFGRIHQR